MIEKIIGADNKTLNEFIHSNGVTKPVKVKEWIDYYLSMSEVVALRSKDAETKVGAVLVDHHNHVIGTGYNSFPRDLPDNLLPNTRDAKYKWMQHAELSCILNCTVSPWSIPSCSLYVTGMPCFNCLKAIWGFNIKTVYYSNWSVENSDGGSSIKEADQDSLLFIKISGMEIYHVR